MKPKIKYVNIGVANSVGNTIYLHKDLKKEDPELYKYCLNHELKHIKHPDKRIELDIQEPSIKYQMKLIHFCVKHPKAFWQFSPFMKLDGLVYLDPSCLLMWAIAFTILSFLIFWVLQIFKTFN